MLKFIREIIELFKKVKKSSLQISIKTIEDFLVKLSCYFSNSFEKKNIF